MDMTPMGQGPEIGVVIITLAMAKIDTNTKAGGTDLLFHQGKIIADIFNTDFFLPLSASRGQYLEGIPDIILPGAQLNIPVKIKMEIKGQGVEGPGLLKEPADLINPLLPPLLVAAAQLEIQGKMDGIGEIMVVSQAAKKTDIKPMIEPAVCL